MKQLLLATRCLKHIKEDRRQSVRGGFPAGNAICFPSQPLLGEVDYGITYIRVEA